MSTGIEFYIPPEPAPLPTGLKLRDDYKTLIPLSENIYPTYKEPTPIVQTQVVNDESFVQAFADKLDNLQRQLTTAMLIQSKAVNDALAAGDDLAQVAYQKDRYNSFVASEMYIRKQYSDAALAYANQRLGQPYPGDLPDLETRYPLAAMISEDEHIRRMKILNHETEQIVEVQTQIVDEPMQTYTAAEIQNQSLLAEYKETLSQLRLQRVTIIQKISGIQADIKELINSQENLIQMFFSEAIAMYPELQGQDIFQIVGTVATYHPLYQVWDQYKPKIYEVEQIIRDKNAEGQKLDYEASEIYNKEQIVLNSYEAFQTSASTPLPTAEQLMSELQAVEAIPYVEESTLRAELPAIEKLSPSAAAMVTLQTLEVQGEGDYSESPEQIEHQEDAQIRPMAFSYDEQVGTPTLPQVAAVAPYIISQVEDPAVANAELKKLGTYIGVAAIVYLFFGGKSRA